jgi:UDP-3-O-[3-hydroxymyristoyl] glucosamine N-acyltransferase
MSKTLLLPKNPVNKRLRQDLTLFVDGSASLGKNVTIGHFVSIHAGVKIGDNTRIEDGAKVYRDCEIGRNCIIGANAVLRPRTKIGNCSIFGTLSCSEGDNSIGDYTTIHAQCHITKGLRIGSNVFVGPFFMCTNTPLITEGRHGTEPADYRIRESFIEDNVRLGASVRMTPGHTIGAFSFIDQDTLITKDIPQHSRVRGGKDKVGKVIGRV